LTQLYEHRVHLFPLFHCTFSHVSYHYSSRITTKVPLDSNTSLHVFSFLTPTSMNLFIIPPHCPEDSGKLLLLLFSFITFKRISSVWQKFNNLNFPMNSAFLSCCPHSFWINKSKIFGIKYFLEIKGLPFHKSWNYIKCWVSQRPRGIKF
jgi:hypothetical protein